MKNKLFKEILLALSLANILFAGSWRIYLYPPTFDYHIKVGPSRIDYLGIIFGVLITAAIFFGIFRLFRYLYEEKANFLINLAFTTLFLFGLNIFRLQFKYSSITTSLAIISQVIFLILMIMMFTKWKHYIFNTAKVAVLMLSPFIFITFSQVFLEITNHASKIDNETSVSNQLANIKTRSKANIKNRVVWIIFDEFDYRIPFDLKAVEMPEFERLKKVSLTAANAESPASNTLEAIPSLLTGKKIKKSEPTGREELTLNFSDDSKSKFSEVPNIFSKVKNLGGDTAVDGFYHSYCRVIGQNLSVCKWMDEDFIPNQSIISSILFNFDILSTQISKIFATASIDIEQTFDKSLVDDKWHIQELIENRSKRLEDVYRIVTDPNIDLAFIHLPIPHPPSRYKMLTKEYSPELQDYVNNLALADIVLRDIRKALEDANQWNDSTIIISTDHPLRVNMWGKIRNNFTNNDRELTKGIADPHIPFFVKMKNQKESIIYEKPFNTIITHDLILDIIKGNIESPKDLEKWLDDSRKLK